MKAERIVKRVGNRLNSFGQDQIIFKVEDVSYSFQDFNDSGACEAELVMSVKYENLRTDSIIHLPESVVSELELSYNESALKYDLYLTMAYSFDFDYKLIRKYYSGFTNENTEIIQIKELYNKHAEYKNASISNIRLFHSDPQVNDPELENEIDLNEGIIELSDYVEKVMK